MSTDDARTIHFIAGLPRSGSTLLCNILAQNPRFSTGTTSGILDVLTAIRRDWSNIESFRASPNPTAKENVLRAALYGYFKDIERPVVFDKSRGWLSYLEMAERLLGRPAKVICPVRDLRDVVASFENIYLKHAALDPLPQERSNPVQWATLEGRVQMWVAGQAPVGSAYNRIKDAIQRGFRDRIHFVEFERLTRNPKQVINEIYDFIGEAYFDHDFENVEQVTIEDDTEFGFPPESLHKIRPRVEPVPPRWPSVLTEQIAQPLAGYNTLWKLPEPQRESAGRAQKHQAAQV